VGTATSEPGESSSIVVVGLGYVGLPLAVVLARHFPVIGFDIDDSRVAELAAGHDRTGEIETEALEASALRLTGDAEDCRAADIYIVTVPTPVDAAKRPDLGAVLGATQMIAGALDAKRRPTIVYESTVYPGVTEDICGGALAAAGLERGRDFRLGYSPERINPGDKVHSIDRIVKVVAGEDEEVVDQLAHVYGAITSAGVFRAASIKAAEAAKVIENAQRDINVAFMNEVAQILRPMGVSMWDVLDAARTKWNFLGFEPGLVGGHCIGVDPYYLSHLAQSQGHHPQVILAGRDTNDCMGGWVADQLHAHRGGKPGTALVLGLTFKENVPDLRNSRSAELIARLEELGHQVAVADPHADPAQVRAEFGRDPEAVDGRRFDLVVGAVKHDEYRQLPGERLAALVAPGGTLADIKAMWRSQALPAGLDYWTL
jgi:UDP-N-acetyl-D-glucosamine/UDP-N-acetyl-D-galactosamine dehydrogenase